GQDVPQVLAPQVADVRFGERPAPADASARVWQENSDFPRSEQSWVLNAVEAGVMRRGWTAVNPGYHRIAATTLVPNRKNHETLEIQAIGSPPAHRLDLSDDELVCRRVNRGQLGPL